MKYLICLTSIIFIFISCGKPLAHVNKSRYLSAKPHEGKYANQMEQGTTTILELYHTTLEKTPNGKYIRKQFYSSNKQITHFETYHNRQLTVLDGKYKEWLDNGSIYKEGQFDNGNKEGEWKYFNTDGKLESFGSYNENQKTGLWTRNNFEGNISSEYNYLKGEKHGPYKLYNLEGELTEKGIYTNGERTTQNILIPVPEDEEEFKIVEKMPMFKHPTCEVMSSNEEQKKCSEKALLQFIYKNIKYPRFSRSEGVEGQVLISFVINKEGKVVDRKVHRGVNDDIATEASRIVDLMPDWNPGIKGDKPVKVLYNLPIRFKLQ